MVVVGELSGLEGAVRVPLVAMRPLESGAVQLEVSELGGALMWLALAALVAALAALVAALRPLGSGVVQLAWLLVKTPPEGGAVPG